MEIQITHYIDRQFGHPVHLGTNDGVIKFAAPADGPVFTAKLRENLYGKTIEEAQAYLKKTFHGYNHIHKFDTPLNNNIEDY